MTLSRTQLGKIITIHYITLHDMNILKRVIERRVRKIMKIDNMQFGFMAGEIYLAKKWMAFVDLEKVLDRESQKVVWWALRYLGVDEWYQ